MYMDQLVANCGHVLHQLRVTEVQVYISIYFRIEFCLVFLCNSKMEWIYTIPSTAI